MTLIFKNMASAVNSTTSVGKNAGAGEASSAGIFGQVLVQQMLNTETLVPAGKDSSSVMLNAPVQLLKDVPVSNSSGETEETVLAGEGLESDEFINLSDLILSFMKDLEKLEKALEENPSLLAQLQNWLLQAASILQGTQVQGQTSGQLQVPSGDMQTLSPLAEHSGTIRFAVQDVLTQLSTMLKNSDLGEQAKPQLMQLAQSFQSLLTGKGNENSKTPAQNQVQAMNVVNDGMDTDTLISTDKKELPISVKPAVNMESITNSNPDLAGEWANASTGDEAGGDGEIHEQQTLTAGQLVLRTGTTAPVKPMAQPVPVEQFAKEMTNLVVNKLEFVKQHGFTEARISLNPEHLGQVDIKISMQNGQLIAQFMTRNSDAKDLIDQQMSQLRSALQGQGLQVERLEVTQSSQSSSSQLYQDGRQPGSGQQESNRRSREKEGHSDDAIAAAAITEEWNEWLADREEVDIESHDSSFTASA